MTREEAIKQLQKIRKFYIYVTPNPNLEAIDMAIQVLQELTNKLQQADTLIIATALQNFAQDSERNISDRERAEELREQVLAYGVSMCKPVILTERESGDIQTELDKDNHTLWVKTNSTEALDSITSVIVQGEPPWCKVFYEAYNTSERESGEWIDTSEGTFCSECDFKTNEYYSYCPNCGARMRGAE